MNEDEGMEASQIVGPETKKTDEWLEEEEEEKTQNAAGNADQPEHLWDKMEKQIHSCNIANDLDTPRESNAAESPSRSGTADKVVATQIENIAGEEDNFCPDDFPTCANVSSIVRHETKLSPRDANEKNSRRLKGLQTAEFSEMKNLGKPDPTDADSARTDSLRTDPLKRRSTKSARENKKPDDIAIQADFPSDSIPEVRFSITKRRTTGSSGLGLGLMRSSRVCEDGESGSDFVSETSDSVFTGAQAQSQHEQLLDFAPLTRESLEIMYREIRRKRKSRMVEFCHGRCGGFGTEFLSGLADRICGRRQQRSRSASAKSGSARREIGPNPKLQQGERLMYPKTEYLKDDLVGKPLMELDSDYYSDTLVVINSRFEIYRFHVSKALGFFSPLNPLRRLSLYLLVNPVFNAIIFLTIMLNCVTMTQPKQGFEIRVNDEKSADKIRLDNGTFFLVGRFNIDCMRNMLDITEYVFLCVYTIEFLVKIFARGFICNKFAYLRDPWNWLDFVVILSAYVLLMDKAKDVGDKKVIETLTFSALTETPSFLRTFRVFRALKTISLISGLRVIAAALIQSIINLKDVAILALFSLLVLALAGLQLFMGHLRQRCVRDVYYEAFDFIYNATINNIKYNLTEGIIEKDKGFCLINESCNVSWVDSKPEYDSTCRETAFNPNYGFTNFDNIGWAMLSTFRLMTQDYWENLYQLALRTSPGWMAIFFIGAIFYLSFYIINLTLAIVAMAYNNQQKAHQDLLDRIADEEERKLGELYSDLKEHRKQDRIKLTLPSSSVAEESSNFRGGGKDIDEKGFEAEKTDSRMSAADYYDGRNTNLYGVSSNAAALPHLQQFQHQTQRSQSQQQSQRDTDSGFPFADEDAESTPTSADHFSGRSLESPIDHVAGFINGSGDTDHTRSGNCEGSDHPRNDVTDPDDALGTEMIDGIGDLTHEEEEQVMDYEEVIQNDLAERKCLQGKDNRDMDGMEVSAEAQSRRTEIVVRDHGNEGNESRRRRKSSRSQDGGRENSSLTEKRVDDAEGHPLNEQSPQLQSQPSQIKPSTQMEDILQKTIPTEDSKEQLLQQNLAGFEREGEENPLKASNVSSTSQEQPEPQTVRRLNMSTPHDEDIARVREIARRKLMRDAWIGRLEAAVNFCCVWECSLPWIAFQEYVKKFIMDPFIDLLVTICILLNTACMALDHEGIDSMKEDLLETANMVFTCIFAAEALLKIVALSPKNYFLERWNVFDFLIAVIALIELLMEDQVTGLVTEGADVNGLTFLRSFRLLRVLKLAKSWPTLNMLLNIMAHTLGALGHLTVVLAIIVFIFSVMGSMLFGSNYLNLNKIQRFDDCTIPRWNFVDFSHSIMIVFRALCGEWIETMWDCMLVSTREHPQGWPCIVWYISTVVIVSLVVLNLFLALLLSSFDAMSDYVPDAETQGVVIALKRICLGLSFALHALKNSFRCFWIKCCCCFRFFWIKCCCCWCLGLGNHDGGKDDNRKQLRTQPNESTKINVENRAVKTYNTRDDLDTANHAAAVHEVATAAYNDLTNRAAAPPAISNPPDVAEVVSGKCDSVDINFVDDGQVSLSLSTKKEVKAFQNGDIFQVEGIGVGSENGSVSDDTEEVQSFHSAFVEGSVRCLPDVFYLKFPSLSGNDTAAWKSWIRLRTVFYDVIEHPFFEHTVTFLILLSSVSLCFEDIYLNDPNKKVFKNVLHWLDKVLTGIFVAEMLAKWLGLGLVRYFTNPWYCLDFVTVTITLVSLGLPMFKFLRVMRALRPLRIISRWEGMRIVVHSLLYSIPAIFNVFLVCLMFWLIFAIAGVQLFKGKFVACREEETGYRLPPHLLLNNGVYDIGVSYNERCKAKNGQDVIQVSWWDRTRWMIEKTDAVNRSKWKETIAYLTNTNLTDKIANIDDDGNDDSNNNITVQQIIEKYENKLECRNYVNNSCWDKLAKCLQDIRPVDMRNVNWTNPTINFDNVLNAYLALLQITTFKGWMGIMENAVDIRDRDQQPSFEASTVYYFYFVIIIIFGSFFTMNLFVGVIIDNFNKQKKISEGEFALDMFMTESQKRYYAAAKKLQEKRPTKAIPRPRLKICKLAFRLVTHKYFDIAVMGLIVANALFMSLEHHDESEQFEDFLWYVNLVFISAFSAECVVKFVGLRFYYFTQPWNIFDLLVVILSILSLAFETTFEKFFSQPSLFRVVRLVRIARVLRLIKGSKGLRTLLFALMMALPALFNICILLFLVVFIYAIFGMALFKNVKHDLDSAINNVFNFETLPNSLLILFQMSTSAGWHDVMKALEKVDDCNSTAEKYDLPLEPWGNCGHVVVARIYVISYLLLTFLIAMNVYIAIILEHFSQATDEAESGLTDDDYDTFYEVWEKFDPKCTQFIKLEVLGDLLGSLQRPLRSEKPNWLYIVKLDIPICESDYVYCVDILNALAREYLNPCMVLDEKSASGGALPSALQKTKSKQKNYRPISSTLERQREIYCARVIQTFYREKKMGESAESGENEDCV